VNQTRTEKGGDHLGSSLDKDAAKAPVRQIGHYFHHRNPVFSVCLDLTNFDSGLLEYCPSLRRSACLVFGIFL
jgi:hypothetical protein